MDEKLKKVIKEELKKAIGEDQKLNFDDAYEENKVKIFKYAACKKKSLDMVKYLVEEKKLDVKIEIDYRQMLTPLHLVVHEGDVNIDILEYLISKGADVNKEDKDENTAIHHALHGKGDVSAVIKYLVSKGANINKANKIGLTPLNTLMYRRDVNLDIVKCLVEKGADVNKENKHGNVPLHRIVHGKNKNIHIVKYLVQHGADVNKENENGEIPLHRALIVGNLDIIKYLVEHGADVNKENKYGYTPFMLAESLEDNDIITYFNERKTLENKNIDGASIFNKVKSEKGVNDANINYENKVGYTSPNNSESEENKDIISFSKEHKTLENKNIDLGISIFNKGKEIDIFNEYIKENGIEDGIQRVDVVFKKGNYRIILRKSNRFYEEAYERLEYKKVAGRYQFVRIEKKNRRKVFSVLRKPVKLIKKTFRRLTMKAETKTVNIPKENIRTLSKGRNI